LSATRLIVATSPYFVLEQIDLAPGSRCEVVADREVWILLVEGEATFDRLSVARGEAVFINAQRVGVRAGNYAVRALVAYVASESVPALLQDPSRELDETAVGRLPKIGKPDGPPPVLATDQRISA